MAYYRLYFMDGSNGHVTNFTEIEAMSMDDAIHQAEVHRGHTAMEL